MYGTHKYICRKVQFSFLMLVIYNVMEKSLRLRCL